MALTLAQYLEELRVPLQEKPIQPELKHAQQEQDKVIREEQDLQAGAILEGLVHDGSGTDTPKQDDLVYVHYSVKNREDDLLFTTMAEEGGSGYPFAFKLEKGFRVPRGWEIALKGMTKGCRKVLQIQPAYAYDHPDCQLPPPAGASRGEGLVFDLHLVGWQSGCRDCGAEGRVYKECLKDGQGWENPRPPFEVTFACVARTLAHNAVPRSGYVYFRTAEGSPITATLGAGTLPEGVELALSHMSKGETSVFILPASLMAQAAPSEGGTQSGGTHEGSTSTAKLLLPQPPSCAEQVELELHLITQVQMRDMTGTGEVMKQRVREGKGEFPMDCPLHDTSVRVHYRARQHGSQQWLFDSRAGAEAAAGAAGAEGAAEPLEFDTGCGEHPEGVEMCAKLMVPCELSLVRCAPKFAYQERGDCPAGINPDGAVEFEVELVSFQRDGHWQQLPIGQQIELAERMKAKGNALYGQKKFKYAVARYDRLHRLLQSIRDFDTDEEVAKVDSLKVAALSNLGLCHQATEDFSAAINCYCKVLEVDPENAKAMFRRGKAHAMYGDYDQAQADLQAALQMDSTIESEVQAALQMNATKRKAAVAKQRSEMRSFLNR